MLVSGRFPTKPTPPLQVATTIATGPSESTHLGMIINTIISSKPLCAQDYKYDGRYYTVLVPYQHRLHIYVNYSSLFGLTVNEFSILVESLFYFPFKNYITASDARGVMNSHKSPHRLLLLRVLFMGHRRTKMKLHCICISRVNNKKGPCYT
jgi:hypothetical protein